MNRNTRYGLILNTLAEISDVKKQLVTQTRQPHIFVPEALIERWLTLYADPRAIARLGLTEGMHAVLEEFDLSLRELMDGLPSESDDPEDYILNDEAWLTVCEIADLALHQLAVLSAPEEVDFSQN